MGGNYPVRKTPIPTRNNIPSGDGLRSPGVGVQTPGSPANVNIPLPSNDNSPFRQFERGTFGRKVAEPLGSKIAQDSARRILGSLGKAAVGVVIRAALSDLPDPDAVVGSILRLGYGVRYPSGIPGWTHQHWDLPFPYDGAPTHQDLYSFWSGPYPLTGQAFNPNTHVGDPIPDSCNTFTWQTDNAAIHPTGLRGGVADAFGRISPAPAGASDPELVNNDVLGTGADAQPSWVHQLDPLTRPGTSTTPAPLPWYFQPLRTANPFLSPTEQSERGYGTVARAKPRLTDSAKEQGITIGPDGKPRLGPKGIGTVRKVPPPLVKERKVNTNKTYRIIRALVNEVTEGLDTLGAFEKALPKAVRRAAFVKHGYVRLSPVDNLKLLYDNYRQIDVVQALENVLTNEVQDQVIGRGNRFATKQQRPWLKKVKLGHGLTVPRNHSKPYSQSAADRAEKKRKGK